MLPILPVDFNNADDDCTVRLVTQATRAFLDQESLQLYEGMDVLITDEELTARAEVRLRDGVWVAVIQGWLDP